MISAGDAPLRTHDAEQITAAQLELDGAGVRAVVGSTVNSAGLTLSKSVPLARLPTFHRSGMGAAPAWQVFCIGGGIAFTDAISAVGDLRLRLDLDATHDLGDGLAWGPANIFLQDGTPSPTCPRGLLAGVERALAGQGLEARVGHEMEFVLVDPQGAAVNTNGWTPYGTGGLLDHESFLVDLLAAMQAAGLSLEQIHSEFGPNQYEFSLPPREPVAAADAVVLARILLGRVARQHGLRVSLSPVPFSGIVGNGAHQHFSLLRDGASLYAGGDGPYGLTGEGASAMAGVLAALPSVHGLLAGSVLSGARMAPGMWSGAHICWSLENREAAVRYLQGGPSNPHGANFEVKVIDPSANTYLASAAILASALKGIADGAELPDEIRGDPSKAPDGEPGPPVLPSAVVDAIDALENAQDLRALISPALIDTTVATRRYELEHFGDQEPEQLAEAFRLTWSV